MLCCFLVNSFMAVHLHYLAFGKNLLVPALWELWPTAQMGTEQRAGNGSILWVLGSRLYSEAAPESAQSSSQKQFCFGKECNAVVVAGGVRLIWPGGIVWVLVCPSFFPPPLLAKCVSADVRISGKLMR